MIPSKTFYFFPLNIFTGLAYYRDATGTIQQINPLTSTFPVDLENAPANWLKISFAFDRSIVYYGLNRSISTEMEFVRDAKSLFEELIFTGLGVEEPLSLGIFIIDSQPQAGQAVLKLYYKAPLDSPDAVGKVFETFTCNLMEGGVSKLLKNYEDTPLSIPCDGSLPEHIKVNYDGTFVQEKLFYQIVSVGGLNNEGTMHTDILASVFLNNEGDSYGAVIGNPTFQNINAPSDLINSTNSVIYFDQQTVVKVKGEIVAQREAGAAGLYFGFWYATSINNTYIPLIPFTDPTLGNEFTVRGQIKKFNFEFTVTLQAYEKLFMPYNFIGNNSSGDNTGKIVSGNFTVQFVTKPQDSRAWSLTAYDLWRLIGKQICVLASTDTNIVSYDFTSDLLQQYLNFEINSGDALRASNDPTYQRYFSVDENNQISFGPVIKITLKQFYESIRVPLMAAVGRGNNGTRDTLFLEVMQAVFNSSVVDYSLGEVSNLSYQLHSKDFRFSDVAIGTAPQTYDQKAGKFETNTTLKMKAPITSFKQLLSLISYIRFDSTGIERLRSAPQTGAATSTTRNDSDNSVFLTVVDRANFIYDYFRALFISLVSNDTDVNNTNIHFAAQQDYQKFDLPQTDGEYFQVNKDYGIFVFSVPGYSATESTTIDMDITINSVNRPPLSPVDTITIKYWRNGVVLFSQVSPVTGIDTHIVISQTFSQAYAHGDCIYITASTSLTCEATITSVNLAIGTYVNMSGALIPVLGGISQKLISMPTVVPTSDPYDGSSVVQSGYQYFQYNSLAFSNNFDTQLGLNGYAEGQATSFKFDVWVNGVIAASYVGAGTVIRSFFVNATGVLNRNYQLNDIVFFTFSTQGASLSVSLKTATANWTSTYVKCYNLYRIQYDSLQGLPQLVTDGTGNFRTDLPGCPYNIEFISPARCRDRWMQFFNSCFFDHVTGDLTNAQLDKNSYLSTSVGGVTITEAAPKPLLNEGRMFYPIVVEFEFYCPLTFAEMQATLINAHVEIFISGVQFFVHILHIEQIPALNDTTTARGLLSSRTDLSTFAKLTGFNIDI